MNVTVSGKAEAAPKALIVKKNIALRGRSFNPYLHGEGKVAVTKL